MRGKKKKREKREKRVNREKREMRGESSSEQVSRGVVFHVAEVLSVTHDDLSDYGDLCLLDRCGWISCGSRKELWKLVVIRFGEKDHSLGAGSFVVQYGSRFFVSA